MLETQMTTYLCFLALFGLVYSQPRKDGKDVDCFKELGRNQLDEIHRNTIIRAFRDKGFMKYDCKFERYARDALMKIGEPTNASTSEYSSEDVSSVDKFLRNGVRHLGVGLGADKVGCYYAEVKNKHKLVCAYK